MSVKYVQLSVAIHGLDADMAALPILLEELRTATEALLTGVQRELFRFRADMPDDIEVAVVEYAGDDTALTGNS